MSTFNPTFKDKLQKIWKFLWESNSIWSWIADFILIFLIVKFVFFPAFGLMFNTSLPFVIIETGSMVHKGNFEQWYSNFGSWYEANNITKAEIENWPYKNGLNPGDIMIVFGKKPSEYKQGDILIFKTGISSTPIIHRIVFIKQEQGKYYFSTKGDNNQGQLSYQGIIVEKDIPEERVIGKAVFRIPYLGWIKLIFTNLFKAIF